MHPGQFIAHFINTAIITAIVAALVLWRYKVGVLAGHETSAVRWSCRSRRQSGRTRGHRRRRCPGGRRCARVGAAGAAARRRGRCRCGAGVLAAARLSRGRRRRRHDADACAGADRSVPAGGGADRGPAGGLLVAAGAASMPWRCWLAGAVLMMAVSALQRLAVGRAPSLDQFLNGVIFLQLTALNAVAPLVVMLVTALPRVRGVAPMTFVGLLVFSLAPLGGSQLTRALAIDQSWRRAGAERGPDDRLRPAGAADRLGGVAVPGGDGAGVRDQALSRQRGAGQRVVGDVRVRVLDRPPERSRLVVAAAGIRRRQCAWRSRSSIASAAARAADAATGAAHAAPAARLRRQRHAPSGCSIASRPGGDGSAPSR